MGQDGGNFGQILGKNRKELSAISRIFDALAGRKCPAA